MIQDTGGVPVSAGDQETWGHFEIVDELALSEAEVLTHVPTVEVATGRLTGLRRGTEIVVGGETYRIRMSQRVRDGKKTMILLMDG